MVTTLRHTFIRWLEGLTSFFCLMNLEALHGVWGSRLDIILVIPSTSLLMTHLYIAGSDP